MPADIFVSYSHKDAALVSPIVKLLRSNQSIVFHDVDSIPPGKRWREELNQALAGARLFVLFWCAHSSKSKEVKVEYRAAIQANKDVLPVILDATPLPEVLKSYQWIDFREAFRPHDSLSEDAARLQAQAASPPASAGRRWSLLVVATLVLALGAASSVFSPGRAGTVPVIVASVVALLIVGVWLWLLRRRRPSHESAPDILAPPPDVDVMYSSRSVDIALWQNRAASRLESQILSRIGAARS